MSEVPVEKVFAARRARVLDQLGDTAVMVLAGNSDILVGRDTELRFLPDPEVCYLTGCDEPDVVLVLAPGHDAPFTLFVRPRDEAKEIWTGPRLGPEGAVAHFGADAAFSIDELAERLPPIIAQADQLYARLETGRPEFDALIRRSLANARHVRPRTGKGPHTLIDPGVLLDVMRVIKDPFEVERIRRAAAITVNGVRDAIRAIRPGAGEWEVEAEIEYQFRRRGADGFAFPTIVASGNNANVLHHVRNDRRMQAGELVLIDAGARFRQYCGDITRTLPVAGMFDPLQRQVYQIVLQAHHAAIAAVRPGASANAPHDAAVDVLIDGMRDLGLLTVSRQEALDDPKLYRTWYPHRTSHWLGLETHDVGPYADRAGAKPLVPGMVLTIEPGLYISRSADAPQQLRGIGIRIEDDVLVTEHGAEVLTSDLPTDPDAVEDLIERMRTD